MTKYEIVCILHSKAELDALKDKIKKIILNNNGEIIEENDWGIKDFAYEIKKQKQGFYFIMIANTSSENITELLRISKITKNIIRVLIINTSKEKDYVQTTKLSATEIRSDKIEHKTIGKKYKKRTFDIKIDNQNQTTEKEKYASNKNKTIIKNSIQNNFKKSITEKKDENKNSVEKKS